MEQSLNIQPALVFDLVLLAVLVLSATASYRRGLLAALVHFVGRLVCLVGAALVSQKAAPALFDRFLRESFTRQVAETIAQQGTVDLTALVEKYAGFLPGSVQEKFLQSARSVLDLNAPDVAGSIVNELVEPLFTPILTVVLFFVTFAVCRMVVGAIVALLTSVNHLPLLGGANRVLGFVFGLLTGGLDVYLVLCAVWAAMVITSGQLPVLNEAALGGSFGYRLFTRINPFV